MRHLFFLLTFFSVCASAQAENLCGHKEKRNLSSRQGVNGMGTESFTYDEFDRLIEVSSDGGILSSETEYEDNGNISYKSEVGTYFYSSSKPHAVEQVNDSCQTISSASQQTSYNAHGKTAYIEEGNSSLSFFYGPDNQRWQTTLMTDGAIGKTLRFLGDYEVVDSGGVQREYWYVADGVVLYRESPSGGMNTGMVLLNGGSFKDAMNSGWQGLWQGAAIGTITGTGRGIVDGQQKLSISKLSPQQKGQVGVERAINEFVAHGGYNIQREVTIEVEGVRIRLDFVGYDELGNLQLFEIKNGPYARPTPNQKIVIPKLQQGVSFIPYGKNATQIHLSIGVPYTGKYKFNYIHY